MHTRVLDVLTCSFVPTDNTAQIYEDQNTWTNEETTKGVLEGVAIYEDSLCVGYAGRAQWSKVSTRASLILRGNAWQVHLCQFEFNQEYLPNNIVMWKSIPTKWIWWRLNTRAPSHTRKGWWKKKLILHVIKHNWSCLEIHKSIFVSIW